MASDNITSDDYLDTVNEQQKEAVTKVVRAAQDFVRWVDQMPDIDDVGPPLVLGAIAARQTRDGSGIAEDEIKRICDWLMHRLTDVMLINGIIRGHLGIKWAADENQPSFWLTERGQKEVHDPEQN